MDAPTRNALKNLDRAAAALRQLPERLARTYAGGLPGLAVGVVDDRFKGQGNHRFMLLSPRYAAWKASRRAAMEHLQRFVGRVVSRPVRGNQPILVRTGFLRERITNPQHHRITVSGDTATILFAALPEYARWLHEGTAKMPKRSPIEPNGWDRARLLEAAKRWLAAQTGKAGPVSIA